MCPMLHKGLRVATGVLVLLCILLPFVAFAQLPDEIVPCDGVDCTVCDVVTLAQRLLNAGIYIAVFLSAILFAWAGWRYVTAGGDSGKATQARETFTNVLIGLVIILVGWLVVDTIMKTLVNESGDFGPWNQICSSTGQGGGGIGPGGGGAFGR